MNLIANSGIQFLKKKIVLSEASPAKKTFFNYCEQIVEKDSQKNAQFIIPFYLDKGNKWIIKTDARGIRVNIEAIDAATWEITDPTKINPEFVTLVPPNVEVHTLQALDVLQTFEGQWLPLPFLRKETFGNKYMTGPTSWARLWYTKVQELKGDSMVDKYSFVLAFDTTAYDNQATYLSPTLADVNNNSFFDCPDDDRNLYYFCSFDWVQDWLESIVKKNKKYQDEEYLKHIGYYFALIKILKKAGVFSEITLLPDTVSNSVEVDLILDLGNSRTCGVLVESDAPGESFDFTKAVPLQIRDLTYPDKTYEDPFDMRLSFVKTTFGDEAAGVKAGNDRLFMWPSMVRIGKESVRLSIIHQKENSNSCMSSPKRYLWDQDKRLYHWTRISENSRFSEPALYGISELFTENGTLLKRALDNRFPGSPDPIPAMNPYFSRSSLMTFAIVEIIMQAISFVNSYEFRVEKSKSNLPKIPRKLRRIVLTCPTAMLNTEKYLLREHATDAIEALKQYYPSRLIDPSLVIIPDISDMNVRPEDRKHWGFDEATCSQLAFVYGEISNRFRFKTDLFFKYCGKVRPDNKYKDQPSVTIASVDIGGGTTDLMICNYNYDPIAAETITKIEPEPLFWEGFNKAGDDILKAVIERFVIPSIADDARKKGANIKDLTSTLNKLFGPWVGSQTAKDRVLQQQFGIQIANPIALGAVKHLSESRTNEIYSFDSFFTDYPFPISAVISYVNDALTQCGAVDFDIRKTSWEMNSRYLDVVVADVVQKMLQDLCGIIAQYNCDFVLLAGRPTMLPVIQELFYRFLPVSPDRIIPMGRYRIGSWYPFADNLGYIKDPKTCVVVGASIALLGGILNRIPNFMIDTEQLKKRFESTADYIGKFESGSGAIEPVYFSPEESGNVNLNFHGEFMLGMRQMPGKHWIGTPMFKLEFSTKELAEELSSRLPLNLTMIQAPLDKEKITITGGITDKTGKSIENSAISLKLQTMADESGYWLDTGKFSIDITGYMENN